MTLTGSPILSSLVYATLGIVIFVVAFVVLDRITPYRLWEEINAKNNMALAIVVGAGLIGLAIIIAAAIHG